VAQRAIHHTIRRRLAVIGTDRAAIGTLQELWRIPCVDICIVERCFLTEILTLRQVVVNLSDDTVEIRENAASDVIVEILVV
jgi:hypothetical protein